MKRGLLILLLAFAPPQAEQDWLSIKEWWGTFEITATSQGSLRDGDADEFTTSTWEETETAFFTFHLDHRARGPAVFPGQSLPSIAELTEKNRWQAWQNLLDKNVDFSIEGNSHEVSVAQTLGEARSIIRDTRSTTKSRVGAATEKCTIVLQVDVKNGRYALRAPVIPAWRSSSIPSSERWTSLHTQDPSGFREADSGDGKGGGSVIRGEVKSVVDGEVDAREFKILNQSLPEKVQGTLSGSMKFPMDLPADRRGKGTLKQEVLVSWTFRSTPPPPIELELEAEGDGGVPLSDWRPKGGTSEQTPGSFLKVTATVVSRAGPLPDKPAYMAIHLIQTSREKGVCMNFPEEAPENPEADFRFREEENGKKRLGDRTIRVFDPKQPDLVATLACFDYGAWGELTATARLESGRRLVSIVKGRPKERKLRLPERPSWSKIATNWKAVGADDADNDHTPPGDGQAGDGLSNYDEYRGFMVNGAWTDTDPATKDFFVRNEAGGVAVPGISLFEKLSKLKVHRLAQGELADDRVVNRNRTDGPKVVDQHGVRLVLDPNRTGECEAVSTGRKPGLPKDVRHVAIPVIVTPQVVNADTGGGSTRWMAYVESSIAHELFHCCNVWHHGEEKPREYGFEQEWILHPSGEIKERNVKITVLDEAGVNIEPNLSWPLALAGGLKGKVVVVHTWQGLSSGDTACVMRYDNAGAFIPPGAPAERRMVLDEGIGGGLCTSPAATGTNVKRFGPCQDKRGNCAGQIVVSDKAKATPR